MGLFVTQDRMERKQAETERLLLVSYQVCSYIRMLACQFHVHVGLVKLFFIYKMSITCDCLV